MIREAFKYKKNNHLFSICTKISIFDIPGKDGFNPRNLYIFFLVSPLKPTSTNIAMLTADHVLQNVDQAT